MLAMRNGSSAFKLGSRAMTIEKTAARFLIPRKLKRSISSRVERTFSEQGASCIVKDDSGSLARPFQLISIGRS
jgi:hypothetical protein